jgi:hypothetical protein
MDSGLNLPLVLWSNGCCTMRILPYRGVSTPIDRIPRGSDVIGVITKEHVADSVADSIKTYPQ